jgi:predicted DCC family thiol-disulfide oxidoreductase YuxK
MKRPTDQPLTVYYDGQCPLCVREISLYRRLDRKGAIQWHDVSQGVGDLACDAVTQKEALDRIHAREADGTILTGAQAFVAMWQRLPGFAGLAPIARRQPVLGLMEAGYGWFAPRRQKISRWLTGRERLNA